MCFRCTFPTADIAVGQRTPLLQGQVGERLIQTLTGLAGTMLWMLRFACLTFLQAYSIRLALEMPDSPSNEELGMFMACINITGAALALLATNVSLCDSREG